MRSHGWTSVALALPLLGCPQPLEEAAAELPPAAAPAEEPPRVPVLVRLENATDKAWDDAFLDEGSLRTFGALAPGAVSEPLPFEWVTAAPRLGFLVGDSWVEREREEGGERLAPGRYVLTVRIGGDVPVIERRREGALPSPEELGQAFARAERTLSSSLARAFVHARRRDTLRCGSTHGVRGRARMRWFVAPSGRPGGVEVLSEAYKGTPVQTCLVTAVKRWRFPRYTGPMPPAGEYAVPLSP